MATAKKLSSLLRELADLTNNATSKEEAIQKGLDSYLYLDNYPMYGGYNLVKVGVKNGGHYNAFDGFPSCGGRIKGLAMVQKLESFIFGLKYNKKAS